MKTHNFLFVNIRGGESDHEEDEDRDRGVDEQVEVAGGLRRLRGHTRALYRQRLPPKKTVQFSKRFRIWYRTGLAYNQT